jgi:hypothetical protein
MTAPVVELRFNPTGLRPGDLSTAGPFLGGPADAIEAALAVARAAMIDQMRAEVRGLAEPTHDQIVRLADLAWQAVAWKYRKISAPIMADAYIHAYRNAQAGDVPMSMIYDLAEKHAEKVGDYFHTSSRDALIEGFNLSVNRRIPAKAAADRVLDAYGLTPRQMRTYVGASQFQTPVSDVLPRSIKAKARAYIDKAFTSRLRKLSKQEEHNIDEQAKQFAWMWLQSKGRLNDKAEKLWITAKDERVCAVCGPLHNKRVKVNERFVTAQGEFWTPGLHPNCRCVIRLLEHTFSKDLSGSQLVDFNRKHNRDEHGQFSAMARTRTRTIDVDTEFENLISAQPKAKPKVDVATRTQFASLLASQPATGFGGFDSPFSYTAPVAQLLGTRPSTKAVEFVSAQTKAQLVNPQAKVQFVNQVKSALDMRAQTETKPALRTAVPTTPLDTPGYYIARPHEFQTDESGKTDISEIDLTQLGEPVFTSSKELAAQEAADEIQGMVEDAVDGVIAEKHGRLWATSRHHGAAYADLSRDQIKDVVQWHAATANQHLHPPGPESGGSTSVGGMWLDFRDQEGNRLSSEKMDYGEIGKLLGLKREDFEIYVLEAREGHANTEFGTTGPGQHWVNPEAKGYTLTGEFEQTPDSMEQVTGVVNHLTDKTLFWNVTIFGIRPRKPKSE